MPIVRATHVFETQFTQVPNTWLRDKRLSLKAIGLLAQLMSHSVGWNVSIKSLAEANGCGLDTIRSAVAELEEAGYLTRIQARNGGKFSEVLWKTTDPDQPSSGLPSSGFPTSVFPTPKNNNLKEEQEKEIYSDWNEAFTEFWEIYPRKAGKGAALRAFRKACMTLGSPEKVLDGARRYRDDPNRVDAYTAHPTTWLNANRWEDDPLPERILSAEERKVRAEAELAARKAREAELENQRRERDRLEREAVELERQRNPVEKCEHNRVKYVCDVCSKDS